MDHIYQEQHFGENWFSYQKLYSRMVELFPSGSKFVEVGSWKGKSSAYMAVEIANSNKQIDFYCVDTWRGSQEHIDKPYHFPQNMLDNLYGTFTHNMSPLEQYFFPLVTTSEKASKKFKDKSLDFVFLDASHSYEDIKSDIISWLPKIKDGGILAGHDYHQQQYGVKKAVDELLPDAHKNETSDYWIYYQNKLANFPSINCVSIIESSDRRKLLVEKFNQYNIRDINFHIFDRYEEGQCNIIMSPSEDLHFRGKGPVTSHLKAIKSWLQNSNEEYTFFCEDDLGFDTIKYWNFNWDEFFQNLPQDWNCIQLAWIREPGYFLRFGYKLRNRCFCDFSGCAYLIKRNFAEKLINAYHPNENFYLIYQGLDREAREEWALKPTAETIIFSNFVPIYSFPLFNEDINCEPTEQKTEVWTYYHLNSYNAVMELWKNTMTYMNIKYLCGKE